MQPTGLTDGSGRTESLGSDATSGIWGVIDSVTTEQDPKGSVDETRSRHKKKWWRPQS